MKLLHQLLVIAATLGATTGVAHAGASAVHQKYCELTDSMGMAYSVILVDGNCPGRHVGDKVVVQAQVEPQDVGKPGAIFVGMTRDGAVYGQFSASGYHNDSTAWRAPQPSLNARTGEWIPFLGGLFTPTDAYTTMPSEPQTYMVVDGPSICARSGGGNIELWVGYGVMTPQDVELVKNFKTLVSSGITEEHLMLTRIQNEMRKSERGWKVLSFACPAPDFGSSF